MDARFFLDFTGIRQNVELNIRQEFLIKVYYYYTSGRSHLVGLENCELIMQS